MVKQNKVNIVLVKSTKKIKQDNVKHQPDQMVRTMIDIKAAVCICVLINSNLEVQK